MQYDEMVSALKKPGQDLLDSWTPEKASAIHMLIGIYDENLEVTEALYNMAQNPDSEEAKIHVIEELGDLAFYLVGLAQDLELAEQVLAYPLPELKMQASYHIMELTTMLKRHLMYQKHLEKPEVVVHMRQILSAISQFAGGAGSSLEGVLEANKLKLLGGRYKEGKYSDEQANSRQDKSGVDTTEQSV